MKVLITKLLSAVQSPIKLKSKTIQRYSVVCQLYKDIRRKIVENSFIMDNTNIMLLEINQKTLGTFDQKKTAAEGIRILEQGISLPLPPMTATRTLPPLRPKPLPMLKAPIPPSHAHKFVLPPITAGTGGARKPVTKMPVEKLSPTFVSQYPDLPKSTLWYQRKQLQKKSAGECVRLNTRRRPTQAYTCKKCGKVRSNQTHKQFSGYWWCEETSTETESDWRERCRQLTAQKKSKTE
jgi:hypothetical protein